MLLDGCSASAESVRSSLGDDPHTTCLPAVSSGFRQELAGLCVAEMCAGWRDGCLQELGSNQMTDSDSG